MKEQKSLNKQFRKELEDLLDRYNVEIEYSYLPDFLMADMIIRFIRNVGSQRQQGSEQLEQ